MNISVQYLAWRNWGSDRTFPRKLISFGDGTGGKRNGSGESDGENLVRMHSISSLRKSRITYVDKDDAYGDSGSA